MYRQDTEKASHRYYQCHPFHPFQEYHQSHQTLKSWLRTVIFVTTLWSFRSRSTRGTSVYSVTLTEIRRNRGADIVKWEWSLKWRLTMNSCKLLFTLHILTYSRKGVAFAYHLHHTLQTVGEISSLEYLHPYASFSPSCHRLNSDTWLWVGCFKPWTQWCLCLAPSTLGWLRCTPRKLIVKNRAKLFRIEQW